MKKYAIITAASFSYAVGVSLFTDPNNMAPGGVTGISIILSRLLPLPTGTLILLLNVPILLFAVWKFGIRFTLSTIYAIALISLFTNVLSVYGAATDDILLAALVGGSLTAVSIGVIFRAGGTTGGMDIVVKALRLHFPHLKTGKIFFIADALVVTLSGIVFRDLNAALYAALSAICASLVMDIVLYGRDEAKMQYIISAHAEQIAERLLSDLDIGVTYINGQGAYSGDNKKVILCVVKKPVSPRVEEIVREEDPDAFMIITSATEVFGEGYKSYFSERV
ncbi:MAG: YitT family protein [Lachnospiraceae bacterium]|nr:YitT family protein [Lachnospiraceae bacterium]MBD5519605.1 YitT family protein [Lachnospiraceae bacterium]